MSGAGTEADRPSWSGALCRPTAEERRRGPRTVGAQGDAAHDALKLVLSGELNLDVECNPLHGPRVRTLIEQLERGETPEKFTYVDEVFFDATNLTEEIISQRGY